MDVKIRHQLIKIEDRVSDRFVILITNYRWLRILEVIRYRCSNRFILKNTRQIYKIHSFIYEWDFDKMYLVINFSRELRKESIACRPCSLNFDDKLLREVPDFCAALDSFKKTRVW